MKSFDMNTLRALYLEEIYLVIKPYCSLGQKAKKSFTPFHTGDEKKITEYYKSLSLLIKAIEKKRELVNILASILTHFEDISSSIKAGGRHPFEMSELYEIKHFIYHYDALLVKLQDIDIIPHRDFSQIFELLDIDGQKSPTFYLSSAYSEKFAALKSELQSIETEIKQNYSEYCDTIKKNMNITILSDTITLSRMKRDEIDRLINSKYFYVDDENFANITLKIRRPDKILTLELKSSEIKQAMETEAIHIREQLTKKILEYKNELLAALDEVGHFDLLFAKSIFAHAYKCTIPTILDTQSTLKLEMKQSFNILLQSELHKMDIAYQKIDLHITDNVNIITGSNMGGKTTILKTIGQICSMTALGLPIPAENASIKLFDNIFYCGSTHQENRADLSSFGTEVFTLQNVIKATGMTLLLLDEFGRSTNPIEGQALFHSVLHYFTKTPDTTLIASTHYSPPNDLKQFTHLQMIGLNKDFIDELTKADVDLINKLKIIHKYMNYQPIKVDENQMIPKSALHIAELLGLEPEIVDRAKTELKI